MVTQTYIISTVKNAVPPKVKMSQYDSASRTIVFTVVDSSGAEVDLTGKAVTVEGTRIDGHAFAVECTVSGATATFTETADMTNQAGDHPAELVVRENGQRLGTMNFVIAVESAAMDENASITPEDQSLFEQLYTSIDDAEAEIGTAKDTALQEIAQGLASGSPLIANTAAGMTDTDEVYLYTGSESGYTAGSWYYYNGTAWVVGGVYGSGTTDTTLSLSGVAADAKATGDALDNLKSDLNASQGLLIGEGEANVSIWEEGSISGIGGNIASSTRIRTKNNRLIGFSQGHLKVSCSSDYEMFLPAYDLTGTYVGRIQTDGQIGSGDGAWSQEVNLINYSSNLFRVVLRNKNDTTATMTVAESSNVLFHGERYAIKTAEGENPTPYVYDEIEIELETGIYDRWNNFTNTGKHSTLSVEKDEKYIIVAQAYSSNDYPVYLLRKGNTIVGYKNIATFQMVQVDLTIPDGADELVINSSRAYISVKKGTPVSAKPYSNWHGKKIAWFGTSIPETSTYNAVLGYPEYVGKLLGATVYNEAVGSSCARRGFRTAESANDPYGWTGMGIAALWNMGSTIAEKNEIISNWESKWRSLTGYNVAMTEGISAKALACSYENKLVQKYIIDNPVDLYVFDHGYNDWKTGDLDMDANDPFDRSTYQGAMNTFIKAVLEANPRARILIVSHYENQERPGLIEMQKGEAEYWNLPFAKLYEHLGWANNRTITTDGYWSNATSNGIWIESGGQEQTLTLKQYHMPDGRHPNTDITGRACMDIAYVLADFINGITPAD